VPCFWDIGEFGAVDRGNEQLPVFGVHVLLVPLSFKIRCLKVDGVGWNREVSAATALKLQHVSI